MRRIFGRLGVVVSLVLLLASSVNADICDVNNLTATLDGGGSSSSTWLILLTWNQGVGSCNPGGLTEWTRYNAQTGAVMASGGGGGLYSTGSTDADGNKRTGEQMNLEGSLTCGKSTTPSYVVITIDGRKDCSSGFKDCGGESDTTVVFLPPVVDDKCELKEGNPINVTTGNNLIRKTDLEIASPQGTMRFARTYNSFGGRIEERYNLGTMGYGWNFNYDYRLRVSGGSPDRWIRFRTESGESMLVFEEGSAGVFIQRRDGERAQLLDNGDNTFTLHREDGRKIHFTHYANDEDLYRADWVEDDRGRKMFLEYASYKCSPDTWVIVVSRIYDEFGNGFGFEHEQFERIEGGGVYEPSGRISAVYNLKTPDQKILYSYNRHTFNLEQVTYPDGRTVTYYFENPEFVHSMTKAEDEEGTSSYYGYDEYNRCIEEYVGENQNHITIDYDGWLDTAWNVTVESVRDGISRSKTYTLSDSGAIRTITKTGAGCCGAPGTSTIYKYDISTGNRLEIENGRGIKKQYGSYDSWGNAQTVTEAVGTSEERITNYTYDPDTNQLLTETKTSVLGAGNKQTIYDYDDPTDPTDNPAIANENPTTYLYKVIEKGYTRDLAGTIAATESVTVYTYTALGQIETIDGPRTDENDVTTYSYYPDDSGEGNNRAMLYQVTNALGQTIEYGDYDVNGKPEYVKDANNVITRYVYNWKGQPTEITVEGAGPQGEDLVTVYDYNGNGDINYIRLAGGGVVDYEYDAAGRLQSVTRRVGPDDQSAAVDGMKYEYDSEGNKIAETLHEGEVSGPVTKSTRYDYDTYSRLWKLIHADNTSQEYLYDETGNRTTVRDEKYVQHGEETTYLYDALNRLKTVTAPGSEITRYGYDEQDNLTQVIDPENTTTSYEYDDFARVLKVDSPDAGITQYRYDEAGNLVYKKDGNNIVTNYTYDALNRLETVDVPGSEEDIAYGYDGTGVSNGIGRLTSITDQSGTLTYHYDKRGNIVTEEKVIGTLMFTTGYDYNLDGNLVKVTYPSGREVMYTANKHGMVTKAEGMMGAAQQIYADNIAYYPYGPAKAYDLGNGIHVNLPRNLDYELTDIQAGSAMNRHYDYDRNGNVQSITNVPTASIPIEQVNSFYANNNNQLTGSTNGVQKTYLYDNAGSIVTEQIDSVTRTYDYNYHQRMKQVTEGETTLGEYTYDSLGRRTKKVTQGTTTYYIYSQSGQLIEECNDTGTWRKDYVYLNSQPLAMIDTGSPEKTYFYHNDHLGTPQRMTDATGTVVWEAAYEPFGKAAVNEDVDGNGETVTSNIRFPGQYFDAETGLHYNWWRYYDAETGRYMRSDPFETAFFYEGKLNHLSLYTYATNNPIIHTDPKGLFTCFSPPIYAPPTYYDPAPEAGPLQCELALKKVWTLLLEVHNGRLDDLQGHCLAHCGIKKGCGDKLGDVLSKNLGYGKETYDEILGDIERFLGKPSNRRRDPSDIKANETGRTCPDGENCEERCKNAWRAR